MLKPLFFEDGVKMKVPLDIFPPLLRISFSFFNVTSFFLSLQYMAYVKPNTYLPFIQMPYLICPGTLLMVILGSAF